MFKTIKSKVITITVLYTILVISTSFISFLLITNHYFEQHKPQSNELIYYIDNTDTLVEIQDINSYSSNNVSTPDDVYTNGKETLIKGIIFPIAAFTLFILLISIILFNTLYNKNIKPALDINNEKVKDFDKFKLEMDSKNDIIKHSEEDLSKINNYIAHEIKNSLSILQSKLLNNSDSDDINAFIQEMATQIDDINALTLSKLGDTTQLDFLLLCSEVIDSMRCNTELIFDENSDYQIKANKNLLKRVVYNILENSYKYGATKSEIYIYRKRGNIICKISNNGDVIDYSKIDSIFNYQYRIDHIKTDGYGIGLSLVKNIIELLNGSIYVESNEKITAFYISLPTDKI